MRDKTPWSPLYFPPRTTHSRHACHEKSKGKRHPSYIFFARGRERGICLAIGSSRPQACLSYISPASRGTPRGGTSPGDVLATHSSVSESASRRPSLLVENIRRVLRPSGTRSVSHAL